MVFDRRHVACAGKKDLEDRLLHRRRALEDLLADIEAGECLRKGTELLLKQFYEDAEEALSKGLLSAKSTDMKALLVSWRCKEPNKVIRATRTELLLERI